GEYAPHTEAGRRLLAHELTHVVQQRAGASLPKNRLSEEGDIYEQQADAAAEQVLQRQSPRLVLARLADGGPLGGAVVQRQRIPGKEPQEPANANFWSSFPPWYSLGRPAAATTAVDPKNWLAIIPDAVAKAGDQKQKEKLGAKKAS